MSFTITGLPASKTHPRVDWEDPDMRVAAWEYDGKFYVVPRIDLTTIDGNADHWPGSGASEIDTSTNALTIDHLQMVQRFYVVGRGYSIGYSIAVDIRGHAWELRGFDFKCAANASHNGHIIAVYCILGANQLASAAMIETIKLVHAESARITGRGLALWTPSGGWWISSHNDLRQYPPLYGKGTPTACDGPALQALHDTDPVGHGGVLRPDSVPAPIPTPTEEDDMIYAAKATSGETIYLGNRVMRWPMGGPDGAASAWEDFQAMVAAGTVHHPITGAVITNPVSGPPRLTDSSLHNLLGAPRDEFKGIGGDGGACRFTQGRVQDAMDDMQVVIPGDKQKVANIRKTP